MAKRKIQQLAYSYVENGQVLGALKPMTIAVQIAVMGRRADITPEIEAQVHFLKFECMVRMEAIVNPPPKTTEKET